MCPVFERKKMDKYAVKGLNERFAHSSPEEMLWYFLDLLGNRIALSSSLSIEDQTLTCMLRRIDPRVRVFTLDTGRLFPETYSLIDKTSQQYGRMEVFFPDCAKVQEMVNTAGVNLFYESIEKRKQCCHVRKLEPLHRAFAGLDAWICGLRREQSVTRHDMQMVEWDESNALLKLNPLINWTEVQVWQYIRQHNVPYNVLHDRHYPSIGCQPCTRAVAADEDIRAGRWWWESPDHKECGLHKR